MPFLLLLSDLKEFELWDTVGLGALCCVGSILTKNPLLPQIFKLRGTWNLEHLHYYQVSPQVGPVRTSAALAVILTEGRSPPRSR